MEAHLSWRVLLFTGGVSVLTGCAFGLAPDSERPPPAPSERCSMPAAAAADQPSAAPLRATLTVAPDRLRRAAGDCRRPPPQGTSGCSRIDGPGLQSRSDRHRQDLRDGVASASTTRPLPRLLPRCSTTQAQDGAGRQRRRSREHAAPDRRRGQALARRRRLHGSGGAGGAAVLAARDHARATST